MAATPQQHRLISHDPARASVLVSVNQAVLYLAIGASGLVGAAGLEAVGARHLVWIAAALAAMAIGLSLLGTQETTTRETTAAAPNPAVAAARRGSPAAQTLQPILL